MSRYGAYIHSFSIQLKVEGSKPIPFFHFRLIKKQGHVPHPEKLALTPQLELCGCQPLKKALRLGTVMNDMTDMSTP